MEVLDAEEIRTTLSDLSMLADEFDDEIVEEFGGERMQDLIDASAAAALFYAHWGYPIPEPHIALRRYRARLLALPSIARVVDEARPWREYFPLKGHAPD